MRALATAVLLFFLAACGTLGYPSSTAIVPKNPTSPTADDVRRTLERTRRAAKSIDPSVLSRLLAPDVVVITMSGDTVRGLAAANSLLESSSGTVDVGALAVASGRFENCTDGVFEYGASLSVNDRSPERRLRSVSFTARWRGTRETPRIAWIRFGTRDEQRPEGAGCILTGNVVFAQHRREFVIDHTLPVPPDETAFFRLAPHAAMQRSFAEHGWDQPFPDTFKPIPKRGRVSLPSILLRQFLGRYAVVEAQATLSAIPGDQRAFNVDSLSGIEMNYDLRGAGVQAGVRARYVVLTFGPMLYRESWRMRESHFWQDPDNAGRHLWNGFVSDTSGTATFVAFGIKGSLHHRVVQRFFAEAWGQYIVGPSRNFPGTRKFQITTSTSRSARTAGLGLGVAF